MSFFASGPASDDSDSDASLSSASSSTKAANKKPARTPGAARGMFATGDSSDSDSDDDSDSDSSSEEEEEMSSGDEDGPKKPAAGGKSKASAFLRGGDSDDSDADSDDEEKGAVKSAKDKREDEIDASLKKIENSSIKGNWIDISTEFDKMLRLLQKVALSTLPGTTILLPPQFLALLSTLPDDVDAAIKAEKSASKKSSQANAKALNSMKQKVKKAQKEFEDNLNAYKKDAEEYTSAYVASNKAADEPTKKEKKSKSAKYDDDVSGAEDADEFLTVGKGGKSLDLSKEGVFKTLKTIYDARGKKNTDRREQLTILTTLQGLPGLSVYARLRILLILLSTRFDFNPASHAYMPLEDWSKARDELKELLALLVEQNGRYQVGDVVVNDDDDEDDEWKEKEPKGDNGVVRIRGSVGALVERLDEEFTKSLQWIDAHGMEYVERLKDESSLYSVLLLSQQWFELVSASESTARIILRRVEHVYSKPDAVVLYLEQTARAAFPDLTSSIIPETQNISQLVHSLCIYLYRSADSLLRTRAMLSHIYHHALNGRYHEARDMLLMSHLQGAITHADQGSQILYNRAIVQLGLSAFRRGLVTETRTILLEIFTSQRPKELLAQGFPQQKFSQSTPEQERADKLRTLPFHMHINLELAEAAFLVSCMLYEIPMLAKGHEDESGRNLPSRPFKKLLDQADRQTFMGAPETTRNCIEQASKALQNADWEGCRDLILQIKIWSLLPDAQGVQDMITRKIQEEGLRTYLNTFAPFYTTLSLALLSKTFSLPVKSVTSIVSKMIHNAALPASLDQIDQVVVFYRVEQTRTQSLAQTLAEKVRSLNESNQKALEIKLGTAGGERGGDGRERGEGGGNAGGQRRGGAGRGRGGRGRGAGRGAFTGQLGNQRRAGQAA